LSSIAGVLFVFVRPGWQAIAFVRPGQQIAIAAGRRTEGALLGAGRPAANRAAAWCRTGGIT